MVDLISDSENSTTRAISTITELLDEHSKPKKESFFKYYFCCCIRKEELIK